MALESEDVKFYFFLLILVVLGALSYMLVAPYIYYIIGAVVLVYITHPLYRRLQRSIGNRTVSSILSMFTLSVVAVIPTIYLADQIVIQGRTALITLSTGAIDHIETSALELQIEQLTGYVVNIDAVLNDALVDASTLFSAELPGIITSALDATIGLFVMAITMYYLFKEGEELLDGLKEIMPLDDELEDKMVVELDRMSKAVLFGHVLVSVVQGILAGIGLWLFGIPNVVFWTFVMIVLGLIPLIGNFLVWGPAGLYLIFMDSEPLLGLGLLVYGTIIVGLSDNILRAHVVGKRGNIHPLLVMIGVIGGLPMFGLLGVVLGPLVLGFFVSLLRVYREDFIVD
ncbi:MAG: AI-2E family transporter [Candidatus Nanohaloarchaeota archaeon QJJ-7]|nr:AI-2E family transporter [Candidatus Nanohaloarchaeota archaeon QJJ-7]